MSLALKVKKFINSEHSGEYVDIILPGEIGINSALSIKQKPKKASAAPQEADDAANLDPEDPMDETDGEQGEAQDIESGYAPERCRIHYMEAGMGEPMLLIHTVGQSLYTWRGVFNLLSVRYRVIAIDLPGFGYSDRPESFGFGVEDYAEVIGRFMDALGIESAHIMGFSMGAAYAARFALQHPERVGRLVLLSPGGLTQEMPLSIRMIDSPLFGFVAGMLYNMSTVEKLLNDAVFDLTNITPDVVEEYYKPIADSVSRRCVRHALQCFDDEPLIARLRDIEVPVLILTGGEDKWHPANSQQMELMHSAIKDCGYTLIRNAGHLMHEEKPERVSAAVFEFIPAPIPEI